MNREKEEMGGQSASQLRSFVPDHLPKETQSRQDHAILGTSASAPTSKHMDVLLQHCCHLELLDLRAVTFGQQNNDVHVLCPLNTLNGSTPCVPRSSWMGRRETPPL